MKKIYLVIIVSLCFHLVKAQNPVPNSSFENWTSGNPNGWTADNTSFYTTITQVTPGNTGTYAAKGQPAVYSDYMYSPVLDAASFPVTENFNNFQFYYKANLIADDEFIGAVILYTAHHTAIGFGVDTVLSNATAFSNAVVPVTYVADSVAAYASVAFILYNSSGTESTSSYFIVDDVSLNLITGVEDITAGNKLNIYPVPAHDWLTVKGEVADTKPVELMLTDVTGRMVMDRKSVTVNGNFIDEQLNISGMAPGIYSLELIAGQRVMSHRVVIQ